MELIYTFFEDIDVCSCVVIHAGGILEQENPG